MNEIMPGIPENDNYVIGGDMNGHLSSESTGYEKIPGGSIPKLCSRREMRIRKEY